jgi:hypothetical protein
MQAPASYPVFQYHQGGQQASFGTPQGALPFQVVPMHPNQQFGGMAHQPAAQPAAQAVAQGSASVSAAQKRKKKKKSTSAA